MIKKYILVGFISLILFSCEQSQMKVAVEKSALDISMISNERDPVCDMPVQGHLSDTARIDNQIWGFCSSACKEKYLNSKSIKK